MAYEWNERRADGTKVRASSGAIPNAERDATAMSEHLTHLLQRDYFIWEKL
jgi:hypothetical protein